MKTRLLIVVVEDDEATRAMLTAAFKEGGHAVYASATLKEAEEFFAHTRPDLIIMDRGLPDGDGISLGSRIKKDPALRGVPLLMLTGKAELSDKVLGLRLGADDYLAKPFEMEELLARADALVRRGQGRPSSRVACGGIVVDEASRRVLVNGDEVALGNREYSLLKALIEKAGMLLSRELLLATVWGGSGQDMKIVDVTVMNLRRKLGPAGCRIVAVRGAGYMLNDPSR